MNEERYILAEFKRRLVSRIRADKAEKGYTSNIDPEDILVMLAEIEAAAVLGEETDEGLPFVDEEVE